MMLLLKKLLSTSKVSKWSRFCTTTCNPTPDCPSPPTSPPSTPKKKDSKSNSLVRQEPGPVRLGFIPDEWFQLFYNKTGVSGFGTFCFTIGITLISKEYYIMDHEYYNGLSVLALLILVVKKLGPDMAKYLDSEIDEHESMLKEGRENTIMQYQELINDENDLQKSSEGSLMLVAAKRENVELQREAAYRERCMFAYRETVKRLEYCANRNIVELAIAKRCMTDWVVEQVRNAVTKDIEQKSVTKCMEDLKYLADTYGTLSAPYSDEDIDSLTEEDATKPPPVTKK